MRPTWWTKRRCQPEASPSPPATTASAGSRRKIDRTCGAGRRRVVRVLRRTAGPRHGHDQLRGARAFRQRPHGGPAFTALGIGPIPASAGSTAPSTTCPKGHEGAAPGRPVRHVAFGSGPVFWAKCDPAEHEIRAALMLLACSTDRHAKTKPQADEFAGEPSALAGRQSDQSRPQARRDELHARPHRPRRRRDYTAKVMAFVMEVHQRDQTPAARSDLQSFQATRFGAQACCLRHGAGSRASRRFRQDRRGVGIQSRRRGRAAAGRPWYGNGFLAVGLSPIMSPKLRRSPEPTLSPDFSDDPCTPRPLSTQRI